MCCGGVFFVHRTWTTLLSVIAPTRICAQATRAQPGGRLAVHSVSEIPSKRSCLQKVLCREPSLSASLCHFSAPNIDSESVVNVCIDRADERSCVVSCASGSLVVGDPAVWTCMTNDSWIDDGLPTCEPQACANMSLGGSVRSEFDGSEGVARTYDGGGLGDNCGEESAHGADETHTCVCVPTAPFPRFTILSRAPRSAVLLPSYRQVRVMMATVSLFRKKAPPLVQRATRPSRG